MLKALLLSWLLWNNIQEPQKSQQDTISQALTQKIQDNFLLYKMHIPNYPHDTIIVQTDLIEENPYEKNKNTMTVAMWFPYGKITINKNITEEEITDYIILHEITHTLKDSVHRPLQYTLNDWVKIVWADGLNLIIQMPDGKMGVFWLIEEAAADYIAYTIKPTEEFTDPRYYALQYFMRILADAKLLSAQDLAKAIQYDDIGYMTHLFNIQKDPQWGDILLSVFSQIYQLGLDTNKQFEKNPKEIEAKVRDFVENYLRF